MNACGVSRLVWRQKTIAFAASVEVAPGGGVGPEFLAGVDDQQTHHIRNLHRLIRFSVRGPDHTCLPIIPVLTTVRASLVGL